MNLDLLLSAHLPGYEPRAEQQMMAEAVREALEGGNRLIVEAGTGTGKSLAYLIPVIEFALREDRKAVVSTYTKALQRQLVEKDLPLLKERLYEHLRFALSVGSENYLCLRRLKQARTYGLFAEDAPEVRALLRWAATTETGIRGHYGNGGLWQKVCRESDLCYGKDCRNYGECFYQLAKARERHSHLIVINHHLFFANLASGMKALPAFDAVVFDEAHELEDVAAGYLGVELSNYRLRYLFDSILSPQGRGLLGRLRWAGPSGFSHAAALLEAARKASEGFFQELSARLERQSVRIRERGFMEDTLSGPLLSLAGELEGLARASTDEEDRREISALLQRCRAAAEGVRAILSQELEGHVYWAEREGRVVRLAATPVDIAGLDVFNVTDSAVFTSATLSTGGNMSYIKGRLGIDDARELILESPFDYREQALLYIAHDLDEPGGEGYEGAATERIKEILRITGGRTLVLFTSHGFLGRAAESVAGDMEGIEVLRQGEADSYSLIEEFKRNGRSAVFGTYTFWQGVDVPGEALECVVITKLPFAVPEEPLVEARMEALQREGKNPFVHYQIPQAAILLKQGFGRLIRTRTDRGVVAILDARVAKRGYGREFLKSLPECKITGSIKDVEEFLQRGEAP